MTVGYRQTTATKKIRALKKRIKVVQGGTSSSKTISILILLIDKCCRRDNLEVSVVSESIPHLKKGALKDFIKIMKSTGRWIEDHYNATDRKYTFSNGSYIEFFSPEAILGSRRHILYVNECNHISFEDYHQLSIRTSDEIYLDYNPANVFWGDTEVKNDPDADFIVLTYLDNEALSENIVKELLKAKEKALTGDTYWINWWNVYGLGLTGSLEGVIFGNFISTTIFPEDCKWTVYGLDFGFSNDVTALTKVGFKEIKLNAGTPEEKTISRIYLDQKIYQTGLTNPDLSRLMKQENVGRTEIIADSARGDSIEELRQMGWNIKPCTKGGGSINHGIQLMKQHEYAITQGSTDLIKEWRGYSWKKDTNQNIYTNEPVDHLNHAIDGIRYVMKYKFDHPNKTKFNWNNR